MEEDMEVRSAIQQIAVEHRRLYGDRRIAAELRRCGISRQLRYCSFALLPVTNFQFRLLGDARRQKPALGLEAGDKLRKKQDTSQSLLCAPAPTSSAEAGRSFSSSRAQLTLEPCKVIASPSTTPRNSLPLFTTTKCTGIGPENTADPVQSGFTM